MPFPFNSSRSRYFIFVLVFGALFLFVLNDFLARPGSESTSYLPRLRPSHSSSSSTCAVNLTLLQDLGLLKPDQSIVKYAQLQLAPFLTGKHQDALDFHKLDVIFPELRAIPPDVWTDATSLRNVEQSIPTARVGVELPSIPRKKPDASHLLFGVATTLKRLDESLEGFRYWASGSGARIHAIVDTPEGTQDVVDRAAAMGFNLEISHSSASMDNRYFSHIQLFQDLKQPRTQWMVFIDDDTFFPNMHALMAMLGRYDPTQPHYVGGLSENSDQVSSWGLWAFGGAGVFLSTPLMDQLATVYDECFKVGFTADWRISQCIYQHTTTKLSWEQGLHQMDLPVDQSGFYESGRQLPLSIHHWKSWIHLDVVAMTAVSAICGVECVLKRFFFKDGWVLTNGFSLVKYSNGWAGEDATMEKTWASFDREHNTENTGSHFLHSLGPLRKKDHEKHAYRLKNVNSEDGVVRQFYMPESKNVDPNAIVEVCWQHS